MTLRMPRAFISYSWDSDEHKQWVCELATKLRQDGVDIMLDQWGVAPGDELPEFMEHSLRENDFVLIVCTPEYKRKSDGRIGGVGYEGHIMTAELFTANNKRKFIPILRHARWGEASPSWLRGKYYIDLYRTDRFEANYQDLLNTLYWRRLQAPPLGNPSHNRNDLNTISVASLSQSLPSASHKESNDTDCLIPYREVNNWGFCDIQKNIIIKAKYDDAFPFSDGLALVNREGKFGFISHAGVEVIAPQYDVARSFSEGLAGVKVSDKYGFIDVTGKVVLQPEYYDVNDFVEGFAGVKLQAAKSYSLPPHLGWDFINKNGQQITSVRYYSIQPFAEGLAAVIRCTPSMNGASCTEYYIDQTGQIALDAESFGHLDSFSEGLACVAKLKYIPFIGFIDSTGLYGFINEDEDVVIPFRYKKAKKFSQGLAPVMIKDTLRWGFIDHAGKETIRFEYNDAFPFSEGLAAVKLNKWGYINKEGQEAISFSYDFVESFSGGLAKVIYNGKKGYIGKDGTQFFE